jgi:hypothetical protein
LRVKRQHGGQGSVAFNERLQGIGVKRQAVCRPCRVVFEGMALGLMHRQRCRNDGWNETTAPPVVV